jgi:hypothetical protein
MVVSLAPQLPQQAKRKTRSTSSTNEVPTHRLISAKSSHEVNSTCGKTHDVVSGFA